MKYSGMSDIVKFSNKLKIILVLGVFAGLVGFVHLAPFVYADKNNLDASSGLSTDIHVGKSEIGANSSSDASVSGHEGSGMSGEINSDTNASVTAGSSDDSHENSHAASSESESHAHYNDKYDKMSASSDDEFIVQSERHLYKPGDSVTIEGSLWSSLISSLGNVSTVSIQVADNGGNMVYSGNGTIDANGDYSAAFVLPSDAKNGAYTVNVNADVSADVLDALSLKAKSDLSSSTKIVVVNPNAIKVRAEGKDFDVEVASNSTTVNNINFDEQNKKLSFTVQGDTGTKGVTQITIPKSLLNGDLTVMIDGHAMAQTDVVKTVDTDTETTLELNYHHSTHQIDIVGTNAIPEFSTVASLVLVVSVMSVIVLSQTRRF
ncbi:MAG TPA: MG2 domain-containing protein [Candidatus Nitrosotalea sp.]|nr:MG2 domain-containing protein [Candidatus Nitrosotalea sp.]